MDTTEPETEGQEENILLNHKLAAGSGNRYVNVYPLLDTGAVYEGQRNASDEKRVFILVALCICRLAKKRSHGMVGRYQLRLVSFRRQIPAGLNFALSGIPYWTTDIGGFVFGNPDDPAFRELFVRWFQFGTFNPILRVHGTRNPDAERTLVVRTRRAEDSRQLRSFALSLVALHLFSGVENDQRELHSDASAGHGFPHRCARRKHLGSIHVSARRFW